MNQTPQVARCNVDAVRAAPRKHFLQVWDGVVVTVINPSETQCAPTLPQSEPERNLTWRDFRRPWWLTERCPELAYVPKDVANCPVLAPFVGALPRIESFNGGHWLCKCTLSRWMKMENQLTTVCDDLLARVYGTPEAKFPLDSFWPEPSQCGYKKTHGTVREAEVAIKHSINAFVALVARCSMAIALTSPPDRDSTKHFWIEILMQKHMPGWWMDELSQSHVPHFAADSRVGCHVCPDPGEWQTQWMNHVPMMVRARLTVSIIWPPWEHLPAVFALFPWLEELYPKNNQDFIFSLPPSPPSVTRYYFGWTSLRGTWATANPEQSRQTMVTPPVIVGPVGEPEGPPAGPGQRPGETFKEFFARRDRSNKDREARESAAERRARLKRQRVADTQAFPDKNTAMFIWEEVGIHHKNVREEWEGLDYRHKLGGRMCRVRWEDHGITQRRYDAFRNEWDLCKDLNPDDVPYVDGESEDDDYYPGLVGTAVGEPIAAPPVPHAIAGHSVPAATQGVVRTKNVVNNVIRAFNDFLGQLPQEHQRVFEPQFEASTTIIQKRFGAVIDSWPPERLTENDMHENRLRLVLGALPTGDEVMLDLDEDTLLCFRAWAAGMVAAAWRQGRSPLEAVWDLSSRNSLSLAYTWNRHPSLQLSIQTLNHVSWYVINYANDQSTTWKVIVNNASSALELMRRREITSRRQATEFLVANGRAFRTIKRPDAQEEGRLEPIPATVLGYRGVNATFDNNDFRAYWYRAHDLLYPRRGRAAILRGGIVWRIALEMWGPSIMAGAVDGPSETVYNTGEPFRPLHGPDYLDDQLTESEIDVICGVYHVLTSNHATQEKHQSWWPRPNAWSCSGLDTGFWTPMAESWFQRRLAKMRAGEAQPYHVQQWKSTLNTGRVALQVRRAVETASKEFIDNTLKPPRS